jgi:hypothetical protein
MDICKMCGGLRALQPVFVSGHTCFESVDCVPQEQLCLRIEGGPMGWTPVGQATQHWRFWLKSPRVSGAFLVGSQYRLKAQFLRLRFPFLNFHFIFETFEWTIRHPIKELFLKVSFVYRLSTSSLQTCFFSGFSDMPFVKCALRLKHVEKSETVRIM